MSEKQFVVNELEILNEDNEWKGECWWAVVNTKRVEDCFECRNKEVALKLCDFLNKATDDFKWQIRRCEKWSAIVKQLKKETEQLKNELRKEKSLREYSDSMYGKDLIVNIRFSNGEWKADVSVIDNE